MDEVRLTVRNVHFLWAMVENNVINADSANTFVTKSVTLMLLHVKFLSVLLRLVILKMTNKQASFTTGTAFEIQP
jgi:hypothetical protein